MPEYKAWISMRERCYNPKQSNYVRYGARGVRVCDAWLRDFEAFFAAVGPKPSAAHSLDRIDNARGYEPGNVRWATREQQAQNRACARWLTFDGETLCQADWARRTGLPTGTLSRRLASGWTVERALTTPGAGRAFQNVVIEHAGERLNIAEWARRTGIGATTIRYRYVGLGWSAQRTLTTPVGLARTAITHDGVTMSVAEWARAAGINRTTLALRLREGWSVERALGQRVRKGGGRGRAA